MQSEQSGSLRAGNTKTKLGAKGMGGGVSKKGFGRSKAGISGTKTSQTEADANIVVVDGHVRTPKELITKKYKEYTEEYLKLLETQQEEERKTREQNEVKVKSSLNSQNDSELKATSSQNQDPSFMSSSKSEAESEPEKKERTQVKESKELSVEELEKTVCISLEQTPTLFTFYLPSTSYRQENEVVKKANDDYRGYVQKRIGSDNYIGRPVQTFNFQHKKIAGVVEKAASNDTGVFASRWDIEDTLRRDRKSEYEVLAEDIRKGVDKEFNNFLMNPFSCLSLEKESIDIHSKYEVPGAAEFLLKDKDVDRRTRSKKTGNSQAPGGLHQVSAVQDNSQRHAPNSSQRHDSSQQSRRDQSSRKEESSKKQDSQPSNKKNIHKTELQLKIKQKQEQIAEEEKNLLNSLMQKARGLPSEQERKLMCNENLDRVLTYIDRILNSQTYHKEYISYRNYPQVQFAKKTAEDEIKNFAKKKKEDKKEELKQPLQYLFTFASKQFQGYSVTAADWNPINKDLLAVTYELIEPLTPQSSSLPTFNKTDLSKINPAATLKPQSTIKADHPKGDPSSKADPPKGDLAGKNENTKGEPTGKGEQNVKGKAQKSETKKKGLLMFWTLKNPAFPQKMFTCDSYLTACKFSIENPNLMACGTADGVIMIFDIRKKDNLPIAQNKESLDKHTNAVWDIQWISRGKGNKGELLVSISADGRITEWSMKKGLEHTDLMLLRRIPDPAKKDAAENMNFRFAAGLSFEFLRGESSMYLASTEEGVIYRCSKSYTQQYLEIYTGHNGPIYKVRTNPFFYDAFLTCSADWSCKLWNWRRDQHLHSFQSLDIYDEVVDIQWSPCESTVFASVCKDGRLQLWDLEKKNMLDPICTVKNKLGKKLNSKTIVRFCKGDPVLITGDVNGEIDVYRLNREETNTDASYQKDKIIRLLYPAGYVQTNSNEEQVKTITHQQEAHTQ